MAQQSLTDSHILTNTLSDANGAAIRISGGADTCRVLAASSIL